MANGDPDLSGLQVALVVGDDALRAAIRMLLTVSGASVTEYRTAQAYLDSTSAPGRCLVVDCQLPDVPRPWLREHVTTVDPHTPIVVVTAYLEEFESVAAARDNIRVIHKPFDGGLFIRCVRDAVHGASRDLDPEPQDLHRAAS